MKKDNIVNEAMTATLVLGFLAIFMALTVEAMREPVKVGAKVHQGAK